MLDEADEMLDLGFLPDVETLLAATPASRHTMLFSATMPGAVVAMARRYMTQPTHIRAADPDDDGQTVKNIKQVVYRAHALDKVEMLARILQARGRGLTIVFARTKRTAAKVADDLVERGFAAGALHGDLGQGAREQALRAFRHGKVDVLVATDVAARGIDVEDVTHVINYQCPEDEKTYLHRTGRTGRAGNKGTAVTFVDWDDIPRWGLIDKALGLGIPEPHRDVLLARAHLYERPRHPRGHQGPPAASRSRPARASAPRSSRTWARPASVAAGVRGGSHSDQIRGNRGGDSRRGSDSRSTGSRSSDPLGAPGRVGPAASAPQAERPADESGEAREGGSRRRRGGRGRGRGEGGAENSDADLRVARRTAVRPSRAPRARDRRHAVAAATVVARAAASAAEGGGAAQRGAEARPRRRVRAPRSTHPSSSAMPRVVVAPRPRRREPVACAGRARARPASPRRAAP